MHGDDGVGGRAGRDAQDEMPKGHAGDVGGDDVGRGRFRGPEEVDCLANAKRMLQHRKQLQMLVALRRAAVDAAVVDDQRRGQRGVRVQQGPRRRQVGSVQVVGLQGEVSRRQHQHRPVETVLVQHEAVARADGVEDDFVRMRVEEGVFQFAVF